MQDLIVIKQLPQIEEHLKELSAEIDEKVEKARRLICTEENVKAIKEVRADLNKEFKEVEQQRKTVKEQILAPYIKFEEIYKQYISDKYQSADNDLKEKINSVEAELKLKKEQEIKEYFDEYKVANNIDFITYKQANINVTLTASMKSLKEQVKLFIDKIVDDLKLIETQEHKAEILVEYKQNLNISNAITTVANRFKAIEEEKKKQEEQKTITIVMNEQHEISKESYEQLKNIFNKPLEQQKEEKQEEILTLRFTVKATKTKLKELKEFLINGGYEYE